MGIIKKKNSVEYIIEYIVDRIGTGELKPGDRLMNERILSEELGVSRVPLREAFSALSILGILEVRQGSGTFVNEYDPDALGRIMNIYSVMNGVSIEDLFEIRIIMERQAVRMAVERASDEEMAKIGEVLENSREQLDHLEEEAIEKYYVLNMFHKAVAQASHNRYLQQFMDALKVISAEYITKTIQDPFENITAAVEGHEKIYQAIKERDSKKAELLIQEHLMEELERIRSSLKEEENERSSHRISSSYTGGEDGGRIGTLAAARTI